MLLRISVDWDHKSFAGKVTHTLAPLRDGLSKLEFDAGPDLKVSACTVNGKSAPFTDADGKLTVNAGHALPRAQDAVVGITYASTPGRGRRSLNGSYGWHWILPDPFVPNRRPGFYTQGESEGNHEWVPIYDYPNDKTTSEVYVEAPDTWFVMGNGRLMGMDDSRATHRRTFHWKMTQPHSTYLLSLAGGEMDIGRAEWEGVPLYYAVPKGDGKYIPASFGDTPDMLSFFSNLLGVKYAWPKYAQTCMFDFGGGMENVSATTLGEGSLVEARDGIWPMASLISHELAHQWFGDLVTTRDWGNIWLNEGFATFFEQLYTEHSRGKDAYDADREGSLRAYLAEARRYKRPIVTDRYPNPDAMFDSHTYPKGGAVLHMLRRQLGDADFFRGLGYYLRKFEYKPVDTHDLRIALEESTGRSLQPFFDQWLYKPGHPVVDYSWTYNDASKQVDVRVQQLQDTKDGTPVYDIEMPVALISGGKVTLRTVTLNAAQQDLLFDAPARPDAVLLDPGHDILMERKEHDWQPGEAVAIAQYAPCVLDRRDAALSLLKGEPTDESVLSVEKTLPNDLMPAAARPEDAKHTAVRDEHPLYVRAVVARLGQLHKADLRPLFQSLLGDPDPDVRAAAVTALGALPKDAADAARFRALVNDREMFDVVRAALAKLAGWDADGSLDVFRKALAMDSRHDVLRLAALNAAARSEKPAAMQLIIPYTAPAYSRTVRQNAIYQLSQHYKDQPAATEAIAAALRQPDPQVQRSAVSALQNREDKAAVAPLRSLAADPKADQSLRDAAKSAADKLEGK